MIAYPFPINIKLNDVNWNGVDTGDKIKVWSKSENSWKMFIREDNTWTGDDVANLIIPIGSSFLYYNSLKINKTLIFQRPY